MGKVKGGKDGLVVDNTFATKSEPLVTVEKLKQVYLYGIDIRDNDGNELPDDVYQQYIDNAVSMLEHYLDISITPVIDHEEYRDYRVNDYADWGFYYLNNYPAMCIKKMELVYFRDEDGEPEVIQQIPNQWIRLQSHDGIVRLIPNARFPANLQVGQTGNYFPEILRAKMVPHLWRITYDYGFEPGKIPVLLNQAISVIAATQALIVGGNLVLGAGIAGSSISIDNLSQSIQTTQSAENSAYSATIKDYGDRLFGKTKDDQFAIMRILFNYYKGRDMNII
jgi:hypothetical protein